MKLRRFLRLLETTQETPAAPAGRSAAEPVDETPELLRFRERLGFEPLYGVHPQDLALAFLADVEEEELKLRAQLRLREESYAKGTGAKWSDVERLRQRLDELDERAGPVFNLANPASPNGVADDRILCGACGRELPDRATSFAGSGLCGECWDVGSGRRREVERPPVSSLAAAVEMILDRYGR